MFPRPATDEPVAWALLAVGVILTLSVTVFYEPINRLEVWIGLHEFRSKKLRIVGIILGPVGIVFALLFFALS